MLKTRKKWISLLVVLTFLLSLLPAGLANAATTYSALTAPKYSDDTPNADLGEVLISIDPLQPGTHQAWVELPADFDVNQVSVVSATYEGGNLPAGTVSVAYDGDNDFLLKIDTTGQGILKDVEVLLDFKDVDIPDGASGDIKVTFDNISGQLLSGSVVIGYVAAGALTVSVIDDDTFSDEGGEVTIRIKEEVNATLNGNDQLKLVLPDGFEWGDVTDVDIVFGDLSVNDIVYQGKGTDELVIYTNGTTSNQRTAIDITVEIEVADPDDADYGDVVAKVKGDYNASPDEITVGTYGDFGATISADDPDVEVFAGYDEQAVSDITIKESLAGSLVNGRTILLTLPSNARWVTIDDTPIEALHKGDVVASDSGLDLLYDGLQGTDDRTLRLRVYGSSTDKAELTIEDIEVALEAGVTGDLVVKVSGSAGLSGEITVAKVVAPITASAEKLNVQVGKYGQAAGDITIKETKAGAINVGTLVLSLPDDVEFDGTPTVEVTEGDLEIDDVDVVDMGDYDTLEIEVTDDSNEASTIVISDIKYVINRVLPEGDIEVDIGGDAVVEASFWDENLNGDFDATTDFYYFEDSTTAATVVNATCVTPAPGEAKVTATFTVGDTKYTVGDAENSMDVEPFIENGRTYLPIRYAAYAVGVSEQSIFWDNATRTATIVKGDRVVQLVADSWIMRLNGAEIRMDAEAKIVNGRFVLPIRWVASALDCSVDWNADTQTVTITQ